MIRKSKGKYVWKKKAIWCNDLSLSPVIHSYLTTLLKAVKEDQNIGIPIYYCEKQAKVEGLESYDWDSEIDLEAAHQLRVKDLEEMVWAFSKDSEPDIRNYDFTYKDLFKDLLGDSDSRTINLECTNEDERNRYWKDCEEYRERKQKALALFAEVYYTLVI